MSPHLILSLHLHVDSISPSSASKAFGSIGVGKVGLEKKDMTCGARMTGSKIDRGKMGNTRILNTAAGPKAARDIKNGTDK